MMQVGVGQPSGFIVQMSVVLMMPSTAQIHDEHNDIEDSI